MKISFLTSGHLPFDDRIFYHLARCLSDFGHEVEIVSSKQNLSGVYDKIIINSFEGESISKRDKIYHFEERLSSFKPDIIICSEPLPVLAARYYSKKQKREVRIVYDVTEWYPSEKNLSGHKIPGRWYLFIKLLVFNIYVSRYVHSFIFGEWYKSRLYRLLFPFSPFVFIPYYPDLKYIPFHNPDIKKGLLRVSYSGKISLEKGYGNFISVLKKLSEKNSALKIEVKIAGWYETSSDKVECEKLFSFSESNISIQIYERQNFNTFLELIKDSDIFLDLRDDNLENNYCLPIKIFYYAAFGRPVIYSDLDAIRKEVEVDKFGFLVNPGNTNKIVQIISDYLIDEELYYKHCKNARNMAVDYYNWKNIEPQLINFLAKN
jgi:glycosyltransferase involved in cell wall biosynthesis